jgi:hypothetical protein
MMHPTEVETREDSQQELSSTSYNSSTAILAGAALIATTLNAQTTTPMTDIDVLNYALTLERLEANFYTEGLKRFAPADFTNSQFSQNLGNINGLFGDSVTGDVFSYLLLIRDHEQTHVQTLIRTITSLGGTPKPACTYNFTYNSIDDFLAIGKVLEDTGVSAYDGAINLIKSPALVTAAATIATVEGRHAAYLRLITGDIPFPNAFDPAKTMADVLAAAGGFISSCPS